MKTYLPAALALVLLTGGAAFAQNQTAPAPDNSQAPPPMHHHHHAPNPARETKHLSKKLGLTADQSAQVQPILADRDQQMQALSSNTSLDPKTMHQQRRAIMQASDQKLATILTPDQQQQYAAMKAAHRHGHNGSQPMQPAPTA